MDLAIEKVCQFILHAREFDVKEGVTDPDSGSNAIDDGNLDALTDSADDSTEEQLREVIAGYNDDERHEMVALVYVGRGDMEPEEWDAAVALAREREASGTRTADYLLGIPNLPDLLDEGLAALGFNCSDVED